MRDLNWLHRFRNNGLDDIPAPSLFFTYKLTFDLATLATFNKSLGSAASRY